MDREKVIKGLECCEKDEDLFICGECPYIEDHKFGFDCVRKMCRDALALLKEQQEYIEYWSAKYDEYGKAYMKVRDERDALLKEQDEEHRRLLSWLGKFCRHIDNGDAWLTDEENTAFFKEKMKQQFGWDTD